MPQAVRSRNRSRRQPISNLCRSEEQIRDTRVTIASLLFDTRGRIDLLGSEVQIIRWILQEEQGVSDQVIGSATRLLEITEEVQYLNRVYVILVALGDTVAGRQ